MNQKFILLLLGIFFSLFATAQKVSLKIITTTDVHASYFPAGENESRQNRGSFAHLQTFLEQHKQNEENLILLDNGDMLQGHPAGYYFNFSASRPIHFAAEAMNELGFDAATVGNHDIETGPEIYNKVRDEYTFPYLAANILHLKTDDPYFTPYTIIERKGVKIAVLGLITPSVPNWLPRKLWEGLEFAPLVSTARKWVEHIQQTEKPDAIIGLFHSGLGEDIPYSDKANPENGVLYIAKYVPGFDIIFNGHDHQKRNMSVINNKGEEVYILAAEPHLKSVAVADLHFAYNNNRTMYSLDKIETSIENIRDLEPSVTWIEKYKIEKQAADRFMQKPLGKLQHEISSRESFFGNSSFTDFVHRIQLELTGSDISFAAPLSFNATLEANMLTMADLFKLYPFENYLYVMELTGKEILDYLEYSYGLWMNTMKDEQDHMLLFRKTSAEEGNAPRLQNPSFNFDSAAGIDYVVDLREKPGDRITIKSMSDGSAFDPNKKYNVSINSYRGSGGGEHLTKGVDIPHSMLENRIRWVSEKDLRSHIAEYFLQKETIEALPLNNWQAIPKDWTERAKQRDYQMLFGEKNH